MPLEQTLMEIEPIFRGTDGIFQFTHPSFQEVLTARQFADEINSGELSVRDAYEQFWSYKEDAGLWDLPRDREWRALLPGWKPILLTLIPQISYGRIIELSDIITDGFFRVRYRYPFIKFGYDGNVWGYNPFIGELCFAYQFDKSLNQELVRNIGELPLLFYDMLIAKSLSSLPRHLLLYPELYPEDKKKMTEKDFSEEINYFAFNKSEDEFYSYLSDLEHIPQKGMISAIHSLVNKDFHEDIRYEMIRILGFVGARESIPVINNILTNDELLDRRVKNYDLGKNNELVHKFVYFRKAFEALIIIHQGLKPQGYNPPIKRLIA